MFCRSTWSLFLGSIALSPERTVVSSPEIRDLAEESGPESLRSDLAEKPRSSVCSVRLRWYSCWWQAKETASPVAPGCLGVQAEAWV